MSDYTMALVSQNGSAPCHQSHIEQLKTCDPSFYEFLRTQNPDLLKFDEGEDAGVSEDDGLEPESDSTSNKSESWKKVAKKSKKVEEDTKTTPVVSIDLTTEMLKKWVAQCKVNLSILATLNPLRKHLLNTSLDRIFQYSTNNKPLCHNPNIFLLI
ncbi:hypothetical protein RF11_15931 [Thelohanellus kitauei]|uniref:Uncharacterized protein n=1 Tax=Thelohanellus kitauei TaxID=669202 RepID=A0A0C2M3W3_THEKT|nr:hypothetical protein RF11_15931 [Thelohanellus kitauei]